MSIIHPAAHFENVIYPRFWSGIINNRSDTALESMRDAATCLRSIDTRDISADINHELVMAILVNSIQIITREQGNLPALSINESRPLVRDAQYLANFIGVDLEPLPTLLLEKVLVLGAESGNESLIEVWMASKPFIFKYGEFTLGNDGRFIRDNLYAGDFPFANEQFRGVERLITYLYGLSRHWPNDAKLLHDRCVNYLHQNLLSDEEEFYFFPSTNPNL